MMYVGLCVVIIIIIIMMTNILVVRRYTDKMRIVYCSSHEHYSVLCVVYCLWPIGLCCFVDVIECSDTRYSFSSSSWTNQSLDRYNVVS